MNTYILDYNNDTATFINEVNEYDTISAENILRFSTVWTNNKEDYKNDDGYFTECNCFSYNGYSIDFYQLSNCGEVLTTFAQ